jgi:CDP-glycerol glycerophosphotransferase (TagB/SpsB family)
MRKTITISYEDKNLDPTDMLTLMAYDKYSGSMTLQFKIEDKNVPSSGYFYFTLFKKSPSFKEMAERAYEMMSDITFDKIKKDSGEESDELKKTPAME